MLCISHLAHTSSLPSRAAATGLLLAKSRALLLSHGPAHWGLLEVEIRREPSKSSVAARKAGGRRPPGKAADGQSRTPAF